MHSNCYKSFLALVVLSVSIILLSCTALSEHQVTLSQPQASPTPSPHTFTLTEISADEALPYFQDQVSQEIFNGIQAVTESGMVSVHTQFRFGPHDDELTSGVATTLQPGEGLTGYLMILSTYKYTHTFGLLTTLDYQPIQVQYNDDLQTLPQVTLEPGVWRAFQVTLSPLAEGLHALVTTYIAEPDIIFHFSPTARFAPVVQEAVGLRLHPYGFGLLIWVTSEIPVRVSDWPEQARFVEPDKTSMIFSASLLKATAPPEGPHMLLLAEDSVEAGQTITYYARLSASLGAGNIPMRILTFWDDRLSQSEVFTMSVEAATQEEYVPYSVHVPEYLEEGEHTLTVVAYPYPYYLRGWGKNGEWISNASFFSHLMARLPITVHNGTKTQEKDRP